MAVEYIGKGSPDGTVLGRSDDLLGFFGTSPTVKATVAITVTTTVAAAAVATDLAALRTELVAKGLIAV